MALKDSLISCWELDEASGNALDSHGSNELTETGGTIGTATGKTGNARDFEGSESEWFQILDNADMRTGDIDFTFAGWINVESDMTFAIALLSKYVGAGTREYILFMDSSENLIWRVSHDGTTIVSVTWSAPLSFATWYWFTVWHDATANQIGISINNGTPVTAAHSTGIYTAGGAAFKIGDGSTGLPYDGLMDQVAFWKRLLTSDEKAEIYNAGAGLAFSEWDAGGGSILPLDEGMFAGGLQQLSGGLA